MSHQQRKVFGVNSLALNWRMAFFLIQEVDGVGRTEPARNYVTNNVNSGNLFSMRVGPFIVLNVFSL